MSNRFSIGKSSVAITMIAVTALFLGLTFSPKVVKAEPMKINLQIVFINKGCKQA